jgi:hypothetical protein
MNIEWLHTLNKTFNVLPSRQTIGNYTVNILSVKRSRMVRLVKNQQKIYRLNRSPSKKADKILLLILFGKSPAGRAKPTPIFWVRPVGLLGGL